MIRIEESTIEVVVELSKQIPEFINPPNKKDYESRISKVPHLILVAYVNEKPAGFKVGYERAGCFYSWMGAVLPNFRRKNIALQLAEYQEEWARQQKYLSITFKTRNQHKNMLIFALRRGFNIIGFKEKDNILTNRILLRKSL